MKKLAIIAIMSLAILVIPSCKSTEEKLQEEAIAELEASFDAKEVSEKAVEMMHEAINKFF